jgi:hypothetical protein
MALTSQGLFETVYCPEKGALRNRLDVFVGNSRKLEHRTGFLPQKGARPEEPESLARGCNP